MNVIAQLKFELAYYNVTDQHVSYGTKKTPPNYLSLIFAFYGLSFPDSLDIILSE